MSLVEVSISSDFFSRITDADDVYSSPAKYMRFVAEICWESLKEVCDEIASVLNATRQRNRWVELILLGQ